jgi:hypothetical protein
MSKVLIGRQTLTMIGRPGIESFTEESPEARQIATWYDTARKECMSAYNFTFNRKTAALSVHTEPPTDTWEYRYVIPSNCLHVWKVMAPESKKAQPFEIGLVGEELTVLTNVYQASAQYGFDLQVAELFPAAFTRALRYLLAHYVAPNLCGEVGIKQAATYLQAHAAYLKVAAAEDANGEHDREEEEPSTIRVR